MPRVITTLAAASPAAAASEAAAGSPLARVSANTASVDEIVAALEVAGVSDADKWVDEIEEYRPYPSDDPEFQKLQDELAKYDASPETIAAILSVLGP